MMMQGFNLLSLSLPPSLSFSFSLSLSLSLSHTKTEEQKQFLLQVVEEHRRKYPDARKSTVIHAT